MAKNCSLKIFLLLISLVIMSQSISTRPPMGLTSRLLGCGINESLIEQMGDKLVRSGLAGKGYQYVKLSDCWQGKRD